MGLITLSEVKTFLVISSTDKDLELTTYIDFASTAIESYCGRVFASGAVTEIHDGGTSSIYLDKLPINNVTQIAEYDGTQYVPIVTSNLAKGELANTNTGANANAVAGVVWNSATGELSRDVSRGSGFRGLNIRYPRTFSNYTNGVRVMYNGGYDTIPGDLKLAVANYIKMLYKQEQGTSSYSLSGENRQNLELSSNFPPHIRRILDLYRIW